MLVSASGGGTDRVYDRFGQAGRKTLERPANVDFRCLMKQRDNKFLDWRTLPIIKSNLVGRESLDLYSQ